jgi:hypothetical protein
LWLYTRDLEDSFAREAEVVAACKELGSDHLVAMLRRKIPSNDPDLQSRKEDQFGYRRMMELVLRHAPQLLRASDADALLDCEARELDHQKHNFANPLNTAHWVVAAADLRPAIARDLLRPAFDRYPGASMDCERARLAVGLWRIVGPTEIKFLVDWFYGDRHAATLVIDRRIEFLVGIAAQRPKDVKQLLAAIAADVRFESLDWHPLWTLADQVNRLSANPVVDPEELRSAWHPLGMDYFDGHQAEATAKYPKETADLLERLGKWRTALREAAKGWRP